MRKLKVKNLAEQYRMTPSAVISELIRLGVDASDINSAIPGEALDRVEAHFAKMNAPQSGGAGGAETREIHIQAPIIVKNFAEALGKRPNEIISDLMKLGELVSINQAVNEATARKLCATYKVELVLDPKEKTEAKPAVKPVKPVHHEPEKLVARPPVATFMGHVDHGKTSLQDKVRHSNVVAGEAGRITQHIGASTVSHQSKLITFIDTPGHAAFTQMRARGANATDIVILVVAADDGFKPQTVEALQHALAAKVPIIVAINKMDLPDADPDRVLRQMQQNNLMSEDWGGEVGTVRVSAKTGLGMSDLLDRILLETEMLELQANPKRSAEGVVLEAQLEQGLGATTNVLVQNGTLKIGDVVLCGEYYGRVKSLIDDKGKQLKSAGPSIPVKLAGLNGVPEAGDQFEVCNNEKEARQIAEERIAANRDRNLAQQNITTVDDLFNRLNSQEMKKLSVLIKSDVRGSGEAIQQSLMELPSEKIKVDVVMNGVGAITENDVMLAAASNSIIVGFHVRVNPGVNDLAKKQGVEIRLYNIIYELIEDITDALTGKLEPEKREKGMGEAKILQIFELTKGPKVCGCIVESGSVRVGFKARVFRQKELIYKGEVASLRRFQDDVKEVKAGLECGIRLDNFNDFIPEDVIELYEIELKKATL